MSSLPADAVIKSTWVGIVAKSRSWRGVSSAVSGFVRGGLAPIGKPELATTRKAWRSPCVAPDGVAAKQGLKRGDVIVEVQQSEVSTLADVQQRVEAVRKQDRRSLLMLIQRQGGMQ